MNTDRFDHLFIQPASFEKSLAFYRDTLGWEVKFAWGEPGTPRGAGLSSGEMTIVIAEDHPAEDNSKSHGINDTRPTVHIAVPDIEARYAELEQSGAALFKPQMNHWGTKWFVAKDPDGNLLAFEQQRST